MKDKILTFIIGVLVGAIIATIGFYIYSKNNKSAEMPNGEPPQMMQNGDNSGMQNGTPPELPNGEKPDGNNNGNPPNMQNSENNEQNSNQAESNS